MFSQLSDNLQDIFKELRGHGTISESNIDAALRQVRLALLEADVDFQVAKKFIGRVKEKAMGEAVLRSITPGQQIVKIFYDELAALLGGDAAPLNVEKPCQNDLLCQAGAVFKKARSCAGVDRVRSATAGGD